MLECLGFVVCLFGWVFCEGLGVGLVGFVLPSLMSITAIDTTPEKNARLGK